MTEQEAIVTISYNALEAFDISNPSEELVVAVGNAFGKGRLGILAVSDIPAFEEKRSRLLPLAAKLASLPDIDQCVHAASFYSVGWSHGKEQYAPGKPDYSKASYYANPLTDHLVESLTAREEAKAGHWKAQARARPAFYADNLWPTTSLSDLEPALKDMGQTINLVGCMIAAVCDVYCQRQGVTTLNLQETLTRSLNPKARLLHYFPTDGDGDVEERLWCGWHNDHGSLTGLVPAMYLDADGQLIPCPPDSDAGLYIQTRNGKVVRAKLDPSTCGFQIGETSQIQSGGVLQATPHAVRPAKQAGVSRESFAVFLEPEFDDPLQIPHGKTMENCQDTGTPLPATVIPLKDRWKPNQTFGDFHEATVTAFATTTD